MLDELISAMVRFEILGAIRRRVASWLTVGHEGEMLTPSKTAPNYAFRDEEPDVPVEVVFDFKLPFHFPDTGPALFSVPLCGFLRMDQVTERWERDPKLELLMHALVAIMCAYEIRDQRSTFYSAMGNSSVYPPSSSRG